MIFPLVPLIFHSRKVFFAPRACTRMRTRRTSSDVESLLLVRQCRFLESALNSNFTTSILTSPDSVSISSITEDIIQLNLSLLLSEAATHPSQKLVHQIASSPEGSWPKLWDLALEQGVFGTTCIQAVLKLLSLHPHSDNTCPVPNCGILLNNQCLYTHFLSAHSELTVSIGEFVDACVHCTNSVFVYGRSLHNTFKSLWH